MRIEDRFTVALPLAQAWEVLRDVERIAPCMPGAQLTEIEGDECRGVIKIKLGAITAQYKGSVHFAEVDDAAHRMVLSAKGRETRGQGNASAEVVVTMVETGGGTEIAIDTDLTISGKIAQFGRGVLVDVSSKLLGEFSRCLEELVGGDVGGSDSDATAAIVAEDDLLAGEVDDEGADPGMALPEDEPTSSSVGEGPDANGRSSASSPTLRAVTSPPPEPLDLLALAGPGMTQRALPIALVADLALLAVVRRPVARWLLSAAGLGLVAVVVGSQRDQ